MADKLPNVEDLEELPDFEDLEELDASKYSQAESAIGGLVTGATGGFRDEIAGGLEAAGQAVGVEGLGASDFGEMGLTDPKLLKGGELLDVYRQRRDQDRLRQAEEREANPGAFTASEVGGAFAMPGSRALQGLSKGLGAGRVGTAAISGAGFGGAASLGTSEADLTKGEVGEALGDVAAGTLSGAAVSGGMSKIGGKLKRGLDTKKIREAGEKRILGTVSPPKDIIKGELLSSDGGLKGIGKVLSEDFINEQGKSVPIMTVGTKPVKVLENVNMALKQQYQKMVPVFSKAQERIDKVIPELRQQAGEAAGSARGGAGFFGEVANEIAEQSGKLRKLEPKQADLLEEWGGEVLKQNALDIQSYNLSKLNAFKQLLGEKLSNKEFSSVDPIANSKKELIKKLYHKTKEEIESLADKASLPGENLGKKIKAMNARYSNLLDAKKAAEFDYTRKIDPGELRYRDFLLPSIAGAATANPLVFIGTLGAAKAVEKLSGRPIGKVAELTTGRGLTKLANMADKLDASKAKPFLAAVKKIGNMPVPKRAAAVGILLKNNPDVFSIHEPSTQEEYKTAENVSNVTKAGPDEISDLIRRIEESDSQSEKRFLGPLREAVEAEKNKRQSLMFGLSSQQAFREMMEKYKKDEE